MRNCAVSHIFSPLLAKVDGRYFKDREDLRAIVLNGGRFTLRGYLSVSGDSFGYQRCEWRRVLLASGEQRLGILSHCTAHASLSSR